MYGLHILFKHYVEKLSGYPIEKRRSRILRILVIAAALNLISGALVAVLIRNWKPNFYTHVSFWFPLAVAIVTVLSMLLWVIRGTGAECRMKASFAISVLLMLGHVAFIVVFILELYHLIVDGNIHDTDKGDIIYNMFWSILILMFSVMGSIYSLVVARQAWNVSRRPMELAVLNLCEATTELIVQEYRAV